MLQIVSDLLILAAVSSVGAAQAPGPVQAGPKLDDDAVKVLNNGVKRSVNCGGHDLIVAGDNDTLQVADCRGIEVVGQRNHIRAKLMDDSYIFASGDNNDIVYIPVPGIEAITRSAGKGNEINSPPMAVDAKNNVPFKAPSKPAHPPG